MGNKTAAWLIVGAVLILLGGILFVCVMSSLKWDFSKLETTTYITNKHQISQEFTDISILTDTADINLVPSENGETEVICFENEQARHSVIIQDNLLTITAPADQVWYRNIGIHTRTSNITVKLPKQVYGALTVKESTGDISVPKDFAFKSIDIQLSTGDVTNHASASDYIKIYGSTGKTNVCDVNTGTIDLRRTTGMTTLQNITCTGDVSLEVTTGKTVITNMECKNFNSNGDTGDLSLTDVVAGNEFKIIRDTGDVKLHNCDASEILINTSTGDVNGSLRTEKVFITHSSTGDINVPETTNGGKCEIRTSTGDINITIN